MQKVIKNLNYINKIYSQNKKDLRKIKEINNQYEKFERRSQYSMFSLIDENEESTSIQFKNIIEETFSNRVNSLFIKYSFIYLLFYLFVVYYLLLTVYNFGYLIICKLFLK
jgi:hypothetical protein